MHSPQIRQRNSSGSATHTNSSGAAIRRGELKISEPIPFNAGVNGYSGLTSNDMNKFPSTKQPDGTWPRKASPMTDMQHVPTTSTGHGDFYAVGRASAGPSLVPSSLSTGPSKNSLSQKKPSGFRATLRRMFSSKRGRSSLSENRYGYHRSDPGNLTSITEKATDARVARHTPQAVVDVTHTSALHSHNPNAEQLPRPSTERNRLKTSRRRRRNTVPSFILTDQEAQILAGPNDDLAVHSWRSAEVSDAHLKRRSRSADALHDMVRGFTFDATPPKTRNDEIKYWRTSIIEHPPPTFQGLTANEGDQDGLHEPPKLAPLQTFDFGLEKPGNEPASIEDRVNTLEVKMFDFEYAIARLQGYDIPKPLLFPKSAPKRRSIHDLFPDKETEARETSSLSSAEPTSFLVSPDDSPMPTVEDENQFRPDRSSKATTIRPFTAPRRSSRRSNAPSPSGFRVTSEQVEKLVDVVREEQAARRQLEEQVSKLQKELEALRTPVYAEIRPISFLTPTPESMETPVAQRTLHRSPRFQYDKTPQPPETSRFSMSDIESDTDDGFQDVYETPQENRFTFETTRGSPLVGVN